MPIVRPTRWDHATLPYVPEGHLPCLMFYLLPGDRVPRVAVPNARGEYPHLIPGMPYMEELAVDGDGEKDEATDLCSHLGGALPVLEFAPPPLQEDAATQVDWEDLPAPPLPILKHYRGPTQDEHEKKWDEEA